MTQQITKPFEYFTDTNGNPLTGGKIYIGTAGADPETNPIAVTWDAAGAIPAQQPIRTNGGLTARNSTPSRVFCSASDYSITVRDKNNKLIYTSLNTYRDISDLAASYGASMVGFLQAGTGAVLRTMQDKAREFVSITDFGAVGDGVTDCVAAIQLAINYATANGKSVYIPDGTFLLDALTFVDPTGLYAQRGQNVFGLLFAKSNVTIFGNGKNSVLKVAGGQLTKTFTYTADVNSGTYQNHAMPGTKGFQVFAQNPVTDPVVNNFYLHNFLIDMNGANNKVLAVNAWSNQSMCQAVWISNGGNQQITKVRFKDAPGSQVIALLTDTYGSYVHDNDFLNCGYLDGTNTHLDDHSTIYTAGQNWVVSGNLFWQDNQWVGRGGCPIEMHGKGTTKGNHVRRYLNMGNLAATTQAGDFVVQGNIGREITALGYDMYCQGGFTFKARINGANDVELTYTALSNTHPAYYVRNFISQYWMTGAGGTSDVEVDGNHIKMVGTPAWTDAEDQLNAVLRIHRCNNFKFRGNTVTGFRGPLVNLCEQKSSTGIFIHGNNFISCGRKHDLASDNAVVNCTNWNTTNSGSGSYGVQADTLSIKNNNYISCAYGSYIGLCGVVVGTTVVAPFIITIDGDTSNQWFTTVSATAATDLYSAQSAYDWSFNYSCSQFLDATALLKVLPQVGTEKFNKAQTGVIKAVVHAGLLPMTFTKMYDMTDWKSEAIKFGVAGPVAGEVSPFGPRQGDMLKVVTNSAGSTAAYFYCITAAAAGAAGTWKTLVLAP